ncbi:transcriptional repressor LexA [bacterium]|nr:MAG: transcriptional repressor LexA [bacterium]
METKRITPKQKNLLDYIGEFMARRGYAPSQREIADRFGFKSLGTVQNYLVRLERQGLLKRPWNAKRAIEPVGFEQAALELPLLGFVAAGRPIEAISNPDSVEVPPTMIGAGENFVLRVKGDSMVGDGIMDGDLVVVARKSDAANGKTVVALVDGEATVKHYYKLGQKIELRSANPFVPTIEVGPERDFRIEGIVIGVIRHCR